MTDDAGTISKVVIPSGQTGAGTYLVTWNGHGDAMALHRIETDGTLTLANSYTYSTWGRPTTATHNGIADLGFRFLYVGAWGVQWDDAHGLDLLYMRARHYSPSLGRFLQPDPSRLDAQLFVYAGNGPVSKVDPSGQAGFVAWFCFTWIGSAICSAAARAGYAALVPLLRLAPAARNAPALGNKLSFVFGRAIGSAHNVARSLQNQRNLASIGIRDNSSGRDAIVNALLRAFRAQGNIVRRQLFGRGYKITKESLVSGPYGHVKMLSVWEHSVNEPAGKLISVIIKLPRSNR